MENLILEPVQGVSGEVNLMGSKSFSNRILLLSALADGTTSITNLPDNDDVRHMRNALLQMNVNFELNPEDPTRCAVTGTGQPFGKPSSDLFLGNAGTAMRFLCSVLCLGKDAEYVLTGIPRMYERPIGDLVDALMDLGADITYLGADSFPPLRIRSKGLNGGEVSIRGNISSQFITALLLAAPMAEKDMIINIIGELTSKPYVDITVYTMKIFGVAVDNNDYKQFVVKAGQSYRSPGEVRVEGDASSATYFLASAAIAGGTVRVWGVGEDSVQGDKCFADVLGSMGAQVTYGPTFIEVARGSSLNAIDIDANHIPDAAMTLAITALFAKGTSIIRNVSNWRLKETDRLKAMATELRKVGATVVEGADSIEITPPEQLNPAEIETYGDHRMAMCFSLVCLGGVPITIKDPSCTRKTFPEFFDILRTIFQ